MAPRKLDLSQAPVVIRGNALGGPTGTARLCDLQDVHWSVRRESGASNLSRRVICAYVACNRVKGSVGHLCTSSTGPTPHRLTVYALRSENGTVMKRLELAAYERERHELLEQRGAAMASY